MATKLREKRTLVYPNHWFKPETWITFIEAGGFSEDWKDLRLDDDELLRLQIVIMASPKTGDLIRGAGGLRKLRFAPKGWHCGKSGAARVLYVHFEEFGIILLVAAYRKNEQDSFPASHKKKYCELIERQRRVFASKTVR